MGTKFTAQHKMNFTTAVVMKLKEEKKDILQEEFINYLVFNLLCERRKAIEIMKAVVGQFNYKEGKIDGKKAYLYQFQK